MNPIPAPFAPTGPQAVRILEQLVAEAWLDFVQASNAADRRAARQFWLTARPQLVGGEGKGDVEMKLTLTPTATVDTIQGKIPARIWEGQTDSGVPVKVWIASVQPQTHDEALLAEFGRELKEMPMKRELSTFDMRLVL